MAKGNVQYTVVDGDSLVKIANKHGMPSPVESARKIWQDKKNESLHAKANMSGRTVNRQLHIGGNKYQKYDHSKFAAGYRGYDQPDQIILYTGEKIWIPDTEWIRHEITDDELINGFVPDYGKKYELVYPAIRVRLDMPEDFYSKSDKYTLTGYDENSREAYNKSLTVGSDAIDNKGVKELVFYATPRKFLYTLEVVPGKNKSGQTPKRKLIFEKRPYNG